MEERARAAEAAEAAAQGRQAEGERARAAALEASLQAEPGCEP